MATTVARAVASPAMATLWVTANRTAHAGIVRVLSGQGNGTLSVVNDKVVLNLGPLITQVKQDLVARGLTIADKIPTVNATFPLFAAPNLAKAQQGYRLLTTLKWVLPLLSHRAARGRDLDRPAPPPRADRRGPRPGRVHAGARRSRWR